MGFGLNKLPIVLVSGFFAFNTYAQSESALQMDPNLKIPLNEANEARPAGEGTQPSIIDGQKKPGAIEKVEVTGSRIKRIDVEGPAPVQILDRKDLDRTGYNSVGDVLRDQAASSFGAMRESSGSTVADVAHVSLRGMGSDRTLVLLNGKRLPSDAVTGAVDLNLIPMAAVERIEILKDGASALYGSDALGGVVNIITRKEFHGSEVNMSQTSPEQKGGQRTEVGLVNGVNRGKLNMVNVVHYRKNDTVFSRDRSWSNKGSSSIGSPGSYRQINPDGTKGNWIADSACPAGQVQVTPGGNFCTFKYSDYSTELPSLEQVSLMSETNYRIRDRYALKLRMSGTQKLGAWTYAPAPGPFTVPAGAADTLGPGGTPLPGVTPGSDVEVRYRLKELGNRSSKIETLGYNVLTGIKGEFADSWEWDLTTSYNSVNRFDQAVSGYALTDQLVSTIESGNFNPFAPEGSRGSLGGAAYKPWQRSVSTLAQTELVTSGEIAELGERPVGLAAGVSVSRAAYTDAFDDKTKQDLVFGSAGSSGGGDRNIVSVFTELSVPLTQKLEMQVAARHDDYSDFGQTTNPRLAAKYQASPELLFRSSAGTGFKAPLMVDLYAADSYGYPTFLDAVSCKREKAAGGPTPSCQPQQYLVKSGGNKNLEEEKSINYNAGVLYQPSRNFNISTDVWYAKMDNVVGLSYDDAMEAERDGQNLAAKGIIVTRDSNGYIEEINAPLQNLSSREVMGIDVRQEAIKDTRLGRIKMSVDHGLMLYYKQEGFPGAGLKNILGDNGLPRWRNTLMFGYSPTERQEGSLSLHTIASNKKSVKEEGSLSQYTTADAQYSYSGIWKGVLSAGVQNVLGSTPPLDTSSPNAQLNSSLYDQIGRYYYVSYKQRF